MGGFTIDGCGTGDSFYPKLYLGNHYCPRCRSIQEYDLMEVKRKIKVFYIPTVSINTKYAVACKKCKNGYYIDDKIRDGLLYGRLAIEVNAGKIIYKEVNKSSTNTEVKKETSTIFTEKKIKYCSCCGEKLEDGQLFCISCGMKVE